MSGFTRINVSGFRMNRRKSLRTIYQRNEQTKEIVYFEKESGF